MVMNHKNYAEFIAEMYLKRVDDNTRGMLEIELEKNDLVSDRLGLLVFDGKAAYHHEKGNKGVTRASFQLTLDGESLSLRAGRRRKYRRLLEQLAEPLGYALQGSVVTGNCSTLAKYVRKQDPQGTFGKYIGSASGNGWVRS